MGTTQLRTSWSTLVQALVDSEGQGVRTRMLLEGVAHEAWVQACGIWRREDRPDSWTCILVRGDPELLHGREFVEEVAAGRTAPDLVPGRGVLVSGQAAGALALTYAGAPESEFELDLVAGLLHVARLVDGAEKLGAPERFEGLVPALPHTSVPRPDPTDEAAQCQPASLLPGLWDGESEPGSRQRIAFQLELESGLEACRIALPASEFVRAVRNLVSNAREALDSRQAGGKILVSLRRTLGAQLVLTVEDSGPGLPGEVLDALNGRGPEGLPGPGLGLAVSWGIALSAGGRLRVAESSECGTRIEFSVPLWRNS